MHCVKVLVGRSGGSTFGGRDAASLHLGQLSDDFVFAGLRRAESRGVGVALAVAVEMIEAGITRPRAPCCFRVSLLEIAEHRVDRRVEAVEIEPIEARFVAGIAQVVVASPEPLDERQHIRIAPHPRRESHKPVQRLATVAAIHIRPARTVRPTSRPRRR